MTLESTIPILLSQWVLQVLHHVEDYNLREAFLPSKFASEDSVHVLPHVAQALLTVRGESL